MIKILIPVLFIISLCLSGCYTTSEDDDYRYENIQYDGMIYSDSTSLNVPGLTLEYYRTTSNGTTYIDVKIRNDSYTNYRYMAPNGMVFIMEGAWIPLNYNSGPSIVINSGYSVNVAHIHGQNYIAIINRHLWLDQYNCYINRSYQYLPIFTPVSNG